MSATRSRALVCDRLTDDLSALEVRDIDVAAPAPGEILLRVRAAALNFPDLLMTQGRYQHKPELPFVPGLEAAGEVVAIGSGVEGLAVGQAVVAHARTGAVARHMLAQAPEVRPMPAGIDFCTGAAYQAAANTAWVSLVCRARLERGETVLVHGASGGVGLATVQLARHLGARVIATGRSEDKLAIVRDNGAHETLLLGTDLRDRVMALTGGKGVDVVFDPVGGDVFDQSLRCLGWGGRLLVVGFVAGRIPEVKANYILIKNLSVIGVRAGEFRRRDPVRGADNAREVDRLVSDGVFRPHICARLPLDRALEGLRMLADGTVVGKVVIEP